MYKDIKIIKNNGKCLRDFKASKKNIIVKKICQFNSPLYRLNKQDDDFNGFIKKKIATATKAA